MSYGMIKQQEFATGIFKTDLTSFLERTIKECLVIFYLPIHKLLALCAIYFCEAAVSKLIIIKSKK